MKGDVHLGDEIDVARAQKTVEVVDVVFVQDKIRRRGHDGMLCDTLMENSPPLSPPRNARNAVRRAVESIWQPDGTLCAD